MSIYNDNNSFYRKNRLALRQVFFLAPTTNPLALSNPLLPQVTNRDEDSEPRSRDTENKIASI
ncbi:hypothetical protein [Nostoc sp. UIC 10630]|uniref:hypothetical protein n=1 Tax=Nostoc sp. UIC 10630 TaxID=2100146 RepID=UPI0013D30555|nr:hypothetical protein [Nostoc sp. UIC 10630]NEU83619.1 hypothetical protein [Nostoc sp. UIC 10630]